MSLWRVYRWPAWIALLSTAGLVLGLFGDGWVDALASAALAPGVAVIAWACWRR